MKLTIEITMDNSAFNDRGELGRILDTVDRKVRSQLSRNVATVCDAPEIVDKLLDYNDNIVGSVVLSDVTRCDECNCALRNDALEECAFCDGKFCGACAEPSDHQDCLEDNDG